MPDADLGESVHAIVQLSEEVSDADLKAWVAARLAPYKVPRTVERHEGYLRDDAGKVRRSALRAERLR